MEKEKTGIVAAILRFVSGMRFPWLFALVALVFGADLLFPDLLPFVDELLLGLLTLLLAAWRRRKDDFTRTVEGRKVQVALPSPDATGDRSASIKETLK
jgi:hypothetical protein